MPSRREPKIETALRPWLHLGGHHRGSRHTLPNSQRAFLHPGPHRGAPSTRFEGKGRANTPRPHRIMRPMPRTDAVFAYEPAPRTHLNVTQITCLQEWCIRLRSTGRQTRSCSCGLSLLAVTAHRLRRAGESGVDPVHVVRVFLRGSVAGLVVGVQGGAWAEAGDRPCRWSRGNTSLIFGDLRAQGGRIADENRLGSPVALSTRLSLTRGALSSTAPAHDQTPPGLVPPISQLGYAGVDFGFQGGGQHPPGALAGDLVNQGTVWCRSVFVACRERGRAFPTDTPTSAYSMTITGSFGKERPLRANPRWIHRS